jgi:hypothetical protein
MIFKRRLNSIYKDYPEHSTGDRVVVRALTGESIESVPWLGVIDRRAAKRMSGAQEVILDFAAYRADLLTPTTWLFDNSAMAGCMIEEGVMVVIEQGRPLIKRRSGADRE